MLLKAQKHFFIFFLFTLLFAIGAQTAASRKNTSAFAGKLELEFGESAGEDLSELDSSNVHLSSKSLLNATTFQFVLSLQSKKAPTLASFTLQKIFRSLSFRGPPSLQVFYV